MLTEEDLKTINHALSQGYEIHIEARAGGPHIVAERIKAKVLRDGRKGGGKVHGVFEMVRT